MKKKNLKILSIISLCIGCIGCIIGGIGVQGFSMPVKARAEIAADDFYVYSAGVRLVNDKNGTGLRFQTRMDADTYNQLQSANTVAKTGTLILPEIMYQNNLTVDNRSAMNIDTTDLWTKTEAGTEVYSIAYVYDIPVSNYGSKLLAASYVQYTDGTVDYTENSPATSMTDVAKTATAEQAAQVAPYIVESVTVKYKNADGSILETETYAYGDTLTPPEVSSVPDGYKFKGWCMKNGAAWDFENWTAQGNVALTATFEQYAGKYVIAESAYETGIDVGGGQQFHKTTEIASAKGFDNVYKYQSSTAGNIHGMNFSSADLTKYSKVSFAVKTASFNFNSETTKELSGWMIFTLTQTSTAMWDLKVTHNGETIYTKTGLNGAYATNGVYSNNALDAILYGNPSGFYPQAKDGDLTVYVSEVRGMPGDGFTIEQKAKIAESAYLAGVDIEGSQFSTTTEISPASGFTNVYKYQSSTAWNIHGMNFDGTDLTAYKTVTFALKTASFNFNSETTKELSGWMIFTLTQTSTAMWDLKVTHNGETIYTKTGLNGAYATNGVYSNNALDAILYGNPSGFYPQAKDGDLTVYVSEVYGAVEANYAGVEVATEKILTDSTMTAESAPSGYNSVYTMTPKSTVSSGSGTELALVSNLDLSKYVRLTYKIKVSGSWVLYDGWSHYYGSDNVWKEVVVEKTASGWAVTFGGATTNKTGNKLSDILAFEMDARLHTDCVPSVIYITELMGYIDPSYVEELPEVTPVVGDKIADSVYTAGIDVGGGKQFEQTNEISPAKGFENVYKYQSSTAGNIHGMNFDDTDLTAYETVTFALKTASFNFNSETTKELSDWMIFTLTQTSTAMWDLVVTHNGETVYTKTGLNGAYNSAANPVYSNNALDAILFGNPSGFTPVSVDGDLTVYVSEVRGELAPIEYWGEKIVNSAVNGGVEAMGEKDTPTDFEKVYKLSGAFDKGVFANVDITGYEEVRFYLTMNQALLLDDWSAYAYPNEGWTLVTLVNTLDGNNTWTVTLADRNDATGANPFTAMYTGTTLKQVLNAWYTSYSDNVLYVTDVRGVKIPGWNDAVTEDATIIGATEVTDMQVPIGYEKLYLSNALSTSGGANSFADVDISSYDEVRFKLKSNSYILWDGWNSLVMLKDNWLEFCLTQNADGTWDLLVDYGGGSYGGATKYTESGLEGMTLKAVLGQYEGSKQSEELVQRIYVTELRGIEKKELTKILVLDTYLEDTSGNGLHGPLGNTESGDLVNVGALELQRFYAEFVGETLSIEYVSLGDVKNLDTSERYIVLGRELASEFGVYMDGGLTKDSAYRLYCESNRDNIYLYGTTNYGTMNAAYGLLEGLYGLRFYTKDVWATNDAYITSEISLDGMNYTFVPSIDKSWAYDGVLTKNFPGTYESQMQSRLGYVNSWQITNGGWHNFTELVSESEYASSHSNWFVTMTNADGDTTSTKTLDIVNKGDEIAPVMAEKLLAEYNNSGANQRTIYAIGLPDVGGWQTNALSVDKSAELVKFANKVAGELNALIPESGRNIKLAVIAYNVTFAAPTESVSLYSGSKVSVSVMVAPIEANMYRSVNDSTVNGYYGHTNQWYQNEIAKWKALVDACDGSELYYWNYSAYYDNYFIPLDTISNMQGRYQAMAALGVSNVIDLGQIGDTVGPDWQALKVFLKGQLAKNANATMWTDASTLKGGLVEEFCDVYYGAASDYMLGLLKAQMDHYKTMSDSFVSSGTDQTGRHVIRVALNKASLWGGSDTMLQGWYNDYIKAALSATTDATIQNRIHLEGLTIRYIAKVVFHASTYNWALSGGGTLKKDTASISVVTVAGATVNDTMAQIITDAKALGINRAAEGSLYVKMYRETNVDGAIDNLA